MKYLATTPEYDKKILAMFPSSRERSENYDGLRDEEDGVPEVILENLINKFEEPNEDVISQIEEMRYVYW